MKLSTVTPYEIVVLEKKVIHGCHHLVGQLKMNIELYLYLKVWVKDFIFCCLC